ncbi:tetraacyldisaccharide 4'-kinase [Aurantimonas sp. Leaf443]|uniref:tetraacyldisaccharide 4'-kinase n=1 Tax=Aurantimonas sp. Leaf443 TaxID=1736378 RepID=UPI0006FE6BBE|nr:tetraacyldisaccharide 4'-kinase [Aurantimonas sp. Leaf443]KQT87982.1 tetraacyldisaccharide 4'-kinase [Aurantimonas sp. Leaf443]
MTGLQAPSFWWRGTGSPASILLAPFAALYGRAALRNMARGERAETGVPVLCVGNLTVGGGGKTPTALALGRAALGLGLTPGFVSRGYGRKGRGATMVDPARHTAADVGDEPLLLASLAPTAVAVDRKQAARLLTQERGCDLLIMDDGFQSARLAIDYALVVVDARRGLGNGRVLPAGPLRAPLPEQVQRLQAFLVVGEGPGAEPTVRLAARANRPVFEAAILPLAGERLAGLRCLAFAGIADPTKFFASLKAVGAEIAEARAFPDHHAFTRAEMDALSARAWREGLQLVTTAKDAARLRSGGQAGQFFLAECEVLDVELRFSSPLQAQRILAETLEAFRHRRLA